MYACANDVAGYCAEFARFVVAESESAVRIVKAESGSRH
jgi:hypothetical protein